MWGEGGGGGVYTPSTPSLPPLPSPRSPPLPFTVLCREDEERAKLILACKCIPELDLPVTSLEESKVYDRVWSRDIMMWQRLKKDTGARRWEWNKKKVCGWAVVAGWGGGGDCHCVWCKRSRPNDSCKSSEGWKKIFARWEKCAEQCDEYTHNAFIVQIEYKCSVYIISGSYRIIDIVCVCLHQCTCYDYKTVNSSTDSTV